MQIKSYVNYCPMILVSWHVGGIIGYVGRKLDVKYVPRSHER